MQTLFKRVDSLQKIINTQQDEQVLHKIKEYYRIGLTYSSNALEGNSLTETETKIVLEEGITIGGRRLRDHFEAVGHADAFDFLMQHLHEKTINEEIITTLHHLFYFRIDEKNAGHYHTQKIYLTGSKHTFPAPQEVPQLMHNLIPELTELRTQLHPVEFAAQVHKKFVFVHPFIDGNGRVARLLMNLALLQEGYSITIIPPMMRPEYLRTLEKAHTNDHDFIAFIAQMVKETQQDYIRLFC